ncbi:hypothetical protein MKY88_13235 [Lysinibacillus sp. FSL R7-0073]|uniref:hypothetical protein n=1 Tax=Lysinibacillus sp. FSL R7-0073 TaxID=2921669 RepID=UPI0030FCD014
MYGIEATLPKASGGTSDPVYTEVQRPLKQLELVISGLQSEGLVEIEKFSNELSMLQKLSTSIEFKTKLITCNKSGSIETLPYK